jgi:hypothetical protein
MDGPERRGSPAGDETADSPPRVKVSGPADFLGLVPYLLGFRPQESLVLLLIRDGRVLLTARIDLPALEATAPAVEQLLDLSQRHHASGLVLLAYGSAAGRARTVAELVARELGPHGLVDALFVDDSRWWSLTCGPGCCPAAGTRYDLRNHPMAAEAVYAGLTAVAGREEIEAQVGGPPAADFGLLEVVTAAVVREQQGRAPRQRQSDMAAAVQEFLAEPRRLSDEECARFAVLAADVAVRDVAWTAMTRAGIDDHLDLWGQVVARTISPWEVPPLCLLGMAAWIAGNGALQNCCTARARRADPDYSMAGLLDDINQRALPPSFWDSIKSDLTPGPGPLAG